MKGSMLFSIALFLVLGALEAQAGAGDSHSVTAKPCTANGNNCYPRQNNNNYAQGGQRPPTNGQQTNKQQQTPQQPGAVAPVKKRDVAELFGQDVARLLRRRGDKIIQRSAEPIFYEDEIYAREAAVFDDDVDLYARYAEANDGTTFEYRY
ncbi:hypothetical protein MMC10_011403 [Thelotrema lepadinum]|nr:hypothetical protein [Thelotrema lepadinum]